MKPLQPAYNKSFPLPASIIAIFFIMTVAPLHAEDADPAGLNARLAKADITAGEKAAQVCSNCHSFGKDAGNRTGPNLWNIVGSRHAHMPGFLYSKALTDMGKAGRVWTDEALNEFLYYPKRYTYTTMNFTGIGNPQKRANLIAWLHTLSDNPIPLPQVK